MKLRFLSWNIKNGGVDAGDTTRLRRQMTALAELELSVIALQECKDWERDNFRTFHLAERLLGLRGYLGRSAHHGCHPAIFIREGAGLHVTEQRHEHGDPWWHGIACVAAEVEGSGQPVQFASCHLAPSSAERRLAEAESFALVQERGLLIAGGDFNALPAAGPEPPGPVSGKHSRKLDRRAAKALEETGLTDVGTYARDTTPTVGHASTLPYQCDRVYTSLPEAAITGFEVITTADADSDHRPVLARFDLARITDGGSGSGGQRSPVTAGRVTCTAAGIPVERQ